MINKKIISKKFKKLELILNVRRKLIRMEPAMWFISHYKQSSVSKLFKTIINTFRDSILQVLTTIKTG